MEKFIKNNINIDNKDIYISDKCDLMLINDFENSNIINFNLDNKKLKELIYYINKKLKVKCDNEILEKIDKIKIAVENTTGILFDQYILKSRETNLFFARMIFCFESSKFCNNSKIGELINRDRTTISYYMKKYYDEFRFNKKFRELAEKTSNIIKNL